MTVTFDITYDRAPQRFQFKGELASAGLVGIYGRNGAGKSTFLQILAASVERKALPGARGYVRWPTGESWQPNAGKGSKSQSGESGEGGAVGIIRGDGSLFPHLTVRQNLLIAPKAHRQPSGLSGWLYRRMGFPLLGRDWRRPEPADPKLYEELLTVLNLSSHEQRFPAELSAGEYQRAEWARALMIRPSVLLLDEPFAHLDWPSRRELLPFLQSLSQRFTVPIYWISHDPYALGEAAAQIAVIDSCQLTGVFLPQSFLASFPDL